VIKRFIISKYCGSISTIFSKTNNVPILFNNAGKLAFSL
jgi:hypothetical protein